MNFSSRDINRIIKNPRGQMALAMGNVPVLERLAREGRERDRLEEVKRLILNVSPYRKDWETFNYGPNGLPLFVKQNPLSVQSRRWLRANVKSTHPNYGRIMFELNSPA